MKRLGALLALCTLGCGGKGPTAPAEGQQSPSGRFWLDPGDYGPPTPAHGTLADSRWMELEACLGLYYTPHGFLIRLRANAGGPLIAYFMSGDQPVGGVYHPGQSVEVLGDPSQIQSWKHEFMHHLLDVKTGDWDGGHERGGLVVYGPHGESQGVDWLRCTTR